MYFHKGGNEKSKTAHKFLRNQAVASRGQMIFGKSPREPGENRAPLSALRILRVVVSSDPKRPLRERTLPCLIRSPLFMFRFHLYGAHCRRASRQLGCTLMATPRHVRADNKIADCSVSTVGTSKPFRESRRTCHELVELFMPQVLSLVIHARCLKIFDPN